MTDKCKQCKEYEKTIRWLKHLADHNAPNLKDMVWWAYQFHRLEEEKNEDLVETMENIPGNYYEWITSKKAQEDPTGGLALDISQDSNFPCTNDHDKIREHLVLSEAASETLDVFEESWVEYRIQYPDRIPPMIQCENCADIHSDVNDVFLVWERSFYIMCKDCVESCVDIKVLPFVDITKKKLEDFFQQVVNKYNHTYDYVYSHYIYSCVAEKMKISGLFFKED